AGGRPGGGRAHRCGGGSCGLLQAFGDRPADGVGEFAQGGGLGAELGELLGGGADTQDPGGGGLRVAVGAFDVRGVGGEAVGGFAQVPAAVAADGVLEGGDAAHRAGAAEFDEHGVGFGVVAERVDLAGGEGGDEGLHEGLHGAAHRLGARFVVAQALAEGGGELVHAEGGVPVEGGGVEVDGADHSGAGLVVGVLVVDGRVVVGLVVDAVDAEGVGDLHGGVDVDVGDVGDHAAEESDVDGVA